MAPQLLKGGGEGQSRRGKTLAKWQRLVCSDHVRNPTGDDEVVLSEGPSWRSKKKSGQRKSPRKRRSRGGVISTATLNSGRSDFTQRAEEMYETKDGTDYVELR